MNDEITKTYVELQYPGLLFSEDEHKEVTERNAYKCAKQYPKAYSLQFYDQVSTTVVVDGYSQQVYGKRKNESPIYYPDGKTFTLDEVRTLTGDYSTLIANMQGNGYSKVVKTRTNNWQPFNEKCEII
jgi:hypothetical protein